MTNKLLNLSGNTMNLYVQEVKREQNEKIPRSFQVVSHLEWTSKPFYFFLKPKNPQLSFLCRFSSNAQRESTIFFFGLPEEYPKKQNPSCFYKSLSSFTQAEANLNIPFLFPIFTWENHQPF